MTEIKHTVQHQPRHRMNPQWQRCIWCGNAVVDIDRFGSTVCPGPNPLPGVRFTKTGEAVEIMPERA